jgi:hypothetical protein
MVRSVDADLGDGNSLEKRVKKRTTKSAVSELKRMV